MAQLMQYLACCADSANDVKAAPVETLPMSPDPVKDEHLPNSPGRGLPLTKVEAEEATKEVQEVQKQDQAVAEFSSSKEDQQVGEFSVCIENIGEQCLGLELDCIDGISALVSGLKDGPFTVAEPRIQVGDRIVEINGSRGEVTAMMEILRSERQRLMLRLIRNRPYLVNISRGNGSIGLALNFTMSMGGLGLLIVGVKEGPIARWNELNKERPISVNDRIIEVNGKRLEPNLLLEELSKASNIKMMILPATVKSAAA
eukprot:TRINITY_DN14009_c0_g1_i1.p1 TRINITY_DN14009_c0_g1~~TRINITY_DN14009_c0_g1_i1.p1  ORF type:complete len:258 (+),score=42.02 TRINITY_DN14009_c0_g1_i1:178-951(+)